IVGGAQENTAASVLGLRQKPDLELRLLSGPTTGPEGSLEPLFDPFPGLLQIVPGLVRPIRPLTDFRTLATLTRIFRAERPDIVHTHSGKAGVLGRLAARLAATPVVIHTIHGPSFGPFQGGIANATLSAAERLAGRCTHHFVVVAHAMTRQYLAAGIGRPAQFTRIFSGFDLAPFLEPPPAAATRARFGFEPGHLVVGKIARLVDLKGHADLLAAAPELIRDLPQLRFFLVGDGPLRARFEAEIARLGLSRFFVFAGLLPPDNIPGALAAMDLLIHLSRREGLPRALPQALAAGRPVVAYDCDGANEVCLNGRTGYLVPPGNLTALRERIRLLAADPQLREEL
ncbi:MAG: glycosyltransferase family 4 protein, partial [Legionella sp.]|nr:glycosyltransferase family 4 protein [Legionella sp.]